MEEIGPARVSLKRLTVDKDLWFLMVVLAITVLLYLGTLPKEFTNWDDDEYVTKNPLIRSLSLENLNRIITEPYFANYAPLTIISYAVDYKLWKLNPAGYHFHNVALHLACIVALYFLLRRLELPRLVILATVCLFAIHPVNVESVSWTSERKNLLAAFFFFLSFYHYVNYSKQRTPLSYLASLLFFLLSILSKASTVVAPLAFLAYEYCWGAQKLRSLRLYDKLPFIAAAEIHTFFSIHAAGAGNALNSYHRGGPFLSMLATGRLFEEYLQILLWPAKLTALIYPDFSPAYSSYHMWLALALMLVVLSVLFVKSRHLFFWASFFSIFLIPVLNVIPLPIMMANRYLYISQVGIWVLISTASIRLIKYFGSLKIAQGALAGTMGLWLLSLPCQTYLTAKIWRNSYTLWTDTISKNLYDGVAHYNLGLYFYNRKLLNRAGHEYYLSLLVNPGYHNALGGMGGYYFEKGKIDQALKMLYAARNSSPDSDVIANNLGKVLAEKGDARRALFMFFRAHYLNPNNLAPLNNIVVLYLRTNENDAAMEMARVMVQRFPNASDGYFRLGMCMEAKGDLKGALRAWEESRQRVNPEDPLVSQIQAKLLAVQQKLVAPIMSGSGSHGS